MYKGKYIGTIGVTHFGVRDSWKIKQVIGRILSCDVGKQVWETSPGVWQIESKEQVDRRFGRNKENL